MNEALKKELTERFRNDMERMDSPEYLKAAQEYESQEYATDSFIFGYEYCLTMLGLDNEKAPSQQGA